MKNVDQKAHFRRKGRPDPSSKRFLAASYLARIGERGEEAPLVPLFGKAKILFTSNYHPKEKKGETRGDLSHKKEGRERDKWVLKVWTE